MKREMLMTWMRRHEQASMLGQLLVQAQLLTSEQLDRIIAHQRRSGQRLGEICIDLDIITHQHLHELLHGQHKMRLAAAILVAALAPLQSYALAAAPPVAVTSASLQPSSGARMLSEAELGGSYAQGLRPEVLAQIQLHDWPDGVQVIGDLNQLLHPLLNFLQADTSMTNVVYDQAHSSATLQQDGTLNLRMPTSIGELNFNNVSVRGSDGPAFGNIAVHNIDLSNTVVTMSLHH